MFCQNTETIQCSAKILRRGLRHQIIHQIEALVGRRRHVLQQINDTLRGHQCLQIKGRRILDILQHLGPLVRRYVLQKGKVVQVPVRGFRDLHGPRIQINQSMRVLLKELNKGLRERYVRILRFE